MKRYLTIYVRAHDGRYHGDGDGLPSPFRLFQALVAGAGISGPLDDQTKQVLNWLEDLPDAPIIAAPHLVRGQTVTMFMPNNDLDRFGGDVRNLAKTRGAQKVWRPRHFDTTVPWIYAWPCSDGEFHAATICALSEKLYQLGRGVDMAWAWGELLDEEALDAQLVGYKGVVWRPSAGDGLLLACPSKGSFESLQRRYQAKRFCTEGGQRVFVQQPKPSYRQISYESPPIRHVFELRSSMDSERYMVWPLTGASSLVVAARDAARARLTSTMPSRSDEIERHLVGRKADGSDTVPAESRVRIIPIPSIGMHYADRGIRRLLVEIPAACPLRSDDVRWAFSALKFFDPETGELHDELKDIVLVPTDDGDILHHYGIGKRARVFRSVTPVAVPEGAKRRRIEPTRRAAEAKRGLERVIEISGAQAAVVQALRHAGVRAPVEAIRVQREPFEARGDRVEPFAEGTRFAKERLWHVEIAFGIPLAGPLLIGDGRFLGLGLMAPVQDAVSGVHAFAVTDGLKSKPQPVDIAQALRRAVMARVQHIAGKRSGLPSFFSGHEPNGAPIRGSNSAHLAFSFDPASQLLLVLAPHMIERRSPSEEEHKYLRLLDDALEGFRELRAGSAGLLALVPKAVNEDRDDMLFGPSQIWESVTPYVVSRHIKGVGAAKALGSDVDAQCRRLGLPRPRVESRDVHAMSGIGLSGIIRLTFAQRILGPLLLGRTRYLGGGLFRPIHDS